VHAAPAADVEHPAGGGGKVAVEEHAGAYELEGRSRRQPFVFLALGIEIEDLPADVHPANLRDGSATRRGRESCNCRQTSAPTAPALHAHLIAEFAAGPDRLLVDLDKVGFTDCVTLGVLVVAKQRANQSKDGAFAVVCTSRRPMHTLELVHLKSVLNVHDTVEDAIPSTR
jgi:anti-anti-sigma factor